MWTNIIGGGISALGSFLGGRAQGRDIRRATQGAERFLREGREAFEDTPIVNTFMPGGEQAFQTRQALLGLGGDPQAARQAFDNYLNSTDFQFALDTGRDAITGSRAARGILDSGRSGAELTRFGSNLGRSYMDNYLAQLQGDAQMGLNANQSYGNVLTGQASEMAEITQRAGQDRAAITGDMYAGIGSGLGQMFGATDGRNRFFGGR